MPDLAFETITLERRGPVAWVTLNRPQALNAWTRQLGQELRGALDHADESDEIRAVVITGAGRAFSSGADLRSGEVGPNVDVLTDLREIYNPVIMRVRTVEVPVVAAVNGVAAGIACSLALAADLIVAAESAYFLLAFANIGLGLDGGASPLLVARVGLTRAAEMALLAERISARQAHDWGLVNSVVPDAELPESAGALAERLARGAPGSYASIKQTLNESALPRLAELMDLEAVLQQRRAQSSDFAEGVSAFLQKRSPSFQGR